MLLLQLTAENPIGDLMNNTEWAFPVAECIHIVGFGIAIGTIAMVDFRMIGAGFKKISTSKLLKDTELWTIIGLFLVLFSGPMIMLSDPAMYMRNGSFIFKMFALSTALVYNFSVHRIVAKRDIAGPGAALAGLMSIALWVSVVFGGLFIAFV